MNRSGLGQAASAIASYGRGPDTMLAHISPGEAKLIDYMQGGRRTNPHTGLPEYGLFGKILKGIARAAAATAGFVLSGGNPLAAAAASGLATKLTGGSWKESLVTGGLSGLTAGIGNIASGAPLMKGLQSAAYQGSTAGLQQGVANSLREGGLQAAGPSFGQQFVSSLMTPTGLGLAATSGLSVANQMPKGGSGSGQPFTLPEDNFRITPLNVQRNYVPFTGDYSRYGEGPQHQFFDVVNPLQRQQMPQVPTLPPEEETQYMAQGGYARGGRRGISAAAMAGRIAGPGDGKSDSIEARLSHNEHVIDAATVALAGNGDSDAGHKIIEEWKRRVRSKAGMKNPKKPSRKIRAESLMPKV